MKISNAAIAIAATAVMCNVGSALAKDTILRGHRARARALETGVVTALPEDTITGVIAEDRAKGSSGDGAGSSSVGSGGSGDGAGSSSVGSGGSGDSDSNSSSDSVSVSGSEGECFENLGFQLLSECLTGDLIDTYPIDGINSGKGRRRMEGTNKIEGRRRLGRNTRESCMDLGGFPIYYTIPDAKYTCDPYDCGCHDGGLYDDDAYDDDPPTSAPCECCSVPVQTYMGCVPACKIYPKQDILDEHCTPVRAGGDCSNLHDGAFQGFVVGFGKNPDAGDTFFAYCCKQSEFVDFHNSYQYSQNGDSGSS